jgi:hypothetical protein
MGAPPFYKGYGGRGSSPLSFRPYGPRLPTSPGLFTPAMGRKQTLLQRRWRPISDPMLNDEAIAVIALTIRAEVAHRLGSLRLLPETEEELAVAMLNALDEAGFEVVRREATSTD